MMSISMIGNETAISGLPPRAIPNGPVGIANFALDAIPFWLRNEVDQNPDKTVTLTR